MKINKTFQTMILSLIALFFIGCSQHTPLPKPKLPFEVNIEKCNKTKSIKPSFTYKENNGLYILNVIVPVNINCMEYIKEASYKIKDKTIVFYYDINAENCSIKTLCNCTSVLEYTIYGLPRSDYEFEVRLNEKLCD